MPARGHRLGRAAEWLALLLLLAKGYRLRHRNWRGAGGELDLVVGRSGEVVFVEVKGRSGNLMGGAVGAVNARKRDRLVRTAAAYLTRHDLWQGPSRFDVVTVQRRRSFPWWTVHHIEDAFQPDLGRLM